MRSLVMYPIGSSCISLVRFVLSIRIKPFSSIWACVFSMPIPRLFVLFFFFCKQKTAYGIRLSLVGSGMCIRDRGTENVLAACRQRGVSRLVYTSSPSVIFDGKDHVQGEETLPYPTRWLCHYPHSKALAEQAVLQAGQSGALRTVSLRPPLIWGPRDTHLIPRLIKPAGSGRLRQVGLGTKVFSVASVE